MPSSTLGPSAVCVRLRYQDSELDLEISDDGRGAATSLTRDGAGQGLVGMRERVALFKGKLRAGPRHGGGFEVKATLPLDPASS